MPLIRSGTTSAATTGEREHPRDCGNLVIALQHRDPTTRRWAARDLADCPGTQAALVAQLQVEEDLSVREVIISTLIGLGGPVSVAGLVECLRSEDAALRNQAILGMQQLPDGAAAVMDSLLKDADPDVRIFAVNVLEGLRHPDVESWLIDVIRDDAHVNVCATALDLLGEVGSVAAQTPLTRLKARFPDEPYIQFAADLALARIDVG
jgi:HEAT repeat protein